MLASCFFVLAGSLGVGVLWRLSRRVLWLGGVLRYCPEALRLRQRPP